jgi:hypothetical protein
MVHRHALNIATLFRHREIPNCISLHHTLFLTKELVIQEVLNRHREIPNFISLHCAPLLTKELVHVQEVLNLFQGGLLFPSNKTYSLALQENVQQILYCTLLLTVRT